MAGPTGPGGTVSTTSYAPRGMVVTTDPLASSAGLAMLLAGGSAADAAVAASAVLGVTSPMMCGMGGDLAMVHLRGAPAPFALNGTGPAGSGADPDAMRAEGFTEMPYHHDIRSVPIPGCVDGWMALHERFGRLSRAEVFGPAIEYATDGFPVLPLLEIATSNDEGRAAASAFLPAGSRAGTIVRRPGIAELLHAVVDGGRDGHYLGKFGEELLALGGGEYLPGDLATPLATWVDPVHVQAWGVDLWTVPPSSQGYLTLLAASIAASIGVPDDIEDPAWAHLLVECARAAGHDRPTVLSDRTDVGSLFGEEAIAARAALVAPDRRSDLPLPGMASDTTHLCVVDSDHMAVSMTQSNAASFGSLIVQPGTGLELQNRGVGFSLRKGSAAEYGPGRRPPHTLSPAVVTDRGALHTVLGAAGGDAQPQVVLQSLVRLLHHKQLPGEILSGPRWALGSPTANGFDTWINPDAQRVQLEVGAPPRWRAGLEKLGHGVDADRVGPTFGQAQIISTVGDALAGATDPRMEGGSVVGY